MALKGSHMPFLVVLTFSRYAPAAVKTIPTTPYFPNLSPRMRFEVKIIKIGLNARNGKVMDKGDILIAFMYKMRAMVSNGNSRSMAR